MRTLYRLLFLQSGISVTALAGSRSSRQASKDVLQHLGYRMYFLTIAGYAKFLAAIAILQSKYRTVKEWAFTG